MQNSKLQFKIKSFWILFVIFTFSFLVFNFCYGATLYLEPAQANYYQDDEFVIDIRIDSEDECINAVETNLTFDNDILEIRDFSKGNSILVLWTEEPEFSNTESAISFSGGIPGGYCGRLVGDPGMSNLLGKLVFRARETDTKLERETDAKIEFLPSSKVFLNDGMGTEAKLQTKGAKIGILQGFPEIQKQEWQETLLTDKNPPEPFQIEIQQEPSLFEGKYFIIFSTTDKETGVDYYEVKEGEKDWKKAVSPYLLEDQDLNSIIKVRAKDKAGNERIAEYVPAKKLLVYWIILIILMGAIVIWWVIRKLKRNQSLRSL